MMINEYRLNLTNKEAQEFVAEQMEAFFFGGDEQQLPPGFKLQS